MSAVEGVGRWLTDAPWRERAISLVLVTEDTVTQAGTLGEKRALTEGAGRLLVLWTGRWTTETRLATEDERAEIRARLV